MTDVAGSVDGILSSNNPMNRIQDVWSLPDSRSYGKSSLKKVELFTINVTSKPSARESRERKSNEKKKDYAHSREIYLSFRRPESIRYEVVKKRKCHLREEAVVSLGHHRNSKSQFLS
jgi:hypothetical protein